MRGGEERHHAIDPVTGRPSGTDLMRVTAAASSGVDAEVTATALLLAGERAARDEAERLGVPCLLVTEDDRTVMAGGMVRGDPTLWLIARASGITAYALITASMLAGLLLRSRPAPARIRPRAVADAHRTLALLAVGALALHAASLVLDGFAHISPAALVVPGLAPRHA